MLDRSDRRFPHWQSSIQDSSVGRQLGVMVHTEDMAEGNGDGEPSVTLQPFVHQVGGHTRLLLLDAATICKPLIVRELNFYLNIPPEMKQFTPRYKGVIQVSAMDDSEQRVIYRRGSRSCTTRPQMSRSLSRDLSTDLDNVVKQTISVKVVPEETLGLGRIFEKSEHSRSETPNQHNFLLLENVASKFYHPCILDLKMGTRQHGDDAPEEKRHRHMAKCAASTSANLGVRLCGMQVYQADYGVYICKDKYFGRRLDEDGFKQALHQFFHNGFQLRTGVILKVIDSLKRLKKVIERQNTFRFYSGSLLILYEGCDAEDRHCGGSCCNSDDHAASHSDTWSGQVHDDDHEVEPDEEDDEDEEKARESQEDEEDVCLSSAKRSSRSRVAKLTHNRPRHMRRREVSEDRSLVDVRMIDFAHTTHEGYTGDSMVHRGPDNGYILGLDNLCRLLYGVLNESPAEKE